jgi:hypothetical protein
MKLMNSKFVRKYQNFNLIRFFRIVWTVIMRPITFVCPSPLDPPPNVVFVAYQKLDV